MTSLERTEIFEILPVLLGNQFPSQLVASGRKGKGTSGHHSKKQSLFPPFTSCGILDQFWSLSGSVFSSVKSRIGLDLKRPLQF